MKKIMRRVLLAMVTVLIMMSATIYIKNIYVYAESTDENAVIEFTNEELPIVKEISNLYYDPWRLQVSKDSTGLIINVIHDDIEYGLANHLDESFASQMMLRLNIDQATVTVTRDGSVIEQYKMLSDGEAYIKK